MVTIEEAFGSKAGKVWEALSKAKKPLSIAEIAEESEMDDEEVFVGLGWLGREGKVKIIENRNKRKYELMR